MPPKEIIEDVGVLRFCVDSCWLLSAVQHMVHRLLSSVIGVGDAHFK